MPFETMAAAAFAALSRQKGRPLRPCDVNRATRTHARLDRLIRLLHACIAEATPMPNRAELAALLGIERNQVPKYLFAARAGASVETRHRKFGHRANAVVEYAVRRGDGDWTPWPTDLKPRREKRTGARPGLPPQFWSPRREKVSSFHVAPSVVEQAKDALRRAGVKLVCHVDTFDRPKEAFAPNLGQPGSARVNVGGRILTERQVVALANGAAPMVLQ